VHEEGATIPLIKYTFALQVLHTHLHRCFRAICSSISDRAQRTFYKAPTSAAFMVVVGFRDLEQSYVGTENVMLHLDDLGW
jgi:hypothetical protein